MNKETYKPEFYELVTADGRIYLQYMCFTCNTKHLIRTSKKEISRIRSSYNIVEKRAIYGGELILHCGKKKKPVIETEGICITIMPKTVIPKPERDRIRKRIERIKKNIPFISTMQEEILSTEKLVERKVKEYTEYKEMVESAVERMKDDLRRFKGGFDL